MDKTLIRKEAKEILDKFASQLEEISLDEEDFHFSREEFSRKEREGLECVGFKKKLLKNVLRKDENFVLVEKWGWK